MMGVLKEARTVKMGRIMMGNLLLRKSDDGLEIPGVLKRERKRKEHPTGESASSFS